MQSGIYVSLSSQMALERRLTTIADNMANVNTVGFRSTDVKFDEMLSRTGNDINAKVAFVSQGNDYLSTKTGELHETGNVLDFAIKGDAFLLLHLPLLEEGLFLRIVDGGVLELFAELAEIFLKGADAGEALVVVFLDEFYWYSDNRFSRLVIVDF